MNRSTMRMIADKFIEVAHNEGLNLLEMQQVLDFISERMKQAVQKLGDQ